MTSPPTSSVKRSINCPHALRVNPEWAKISFITEPEVIRRILDHLTQKNSRSRAPPNVSLVITHHCFNAAVQFSTTVMGKACDPSLARMIRKRLPSAVTA